MQKIRRRRQFSLFLYKMQIFFSTSGFKKKQNQTNQLLQTNASAFLGLEGSMKAFSLSEAAARCADHKAGQFHLLRTQH